MCGARRAGRCKRCGILAQLRARVGMGCYWIAPAGAALRLIMSRGGGPLQMGALHDAPRLTVFHSSAFFMMGVMRGVKNARRFFLTKSMACMINWWATLESNQARVASAELQSAAAPCSTSPTDGGCIRGARGRQEANRRNFACTRRRPRRIVRATSKRVI